MSNFNAYYFVVVMLRFYGLSHIHFERVGIVGGVENQSAASTEQ